MSGQVVDPEAVALLEELVRIPSPSGAEGEAAAFLRDWMARHGFEAWIDEAGNAIGVLGTALTPAQARALLRYTPSKRVVLAFDADKAGQAA
ncbi:MAG: toprim domain-containing protein, partial [Thermoflexus sp.]